MPIIDLMSELPYAAALTADEIPNRCLLCFKPKNPETGSIRCHRCGVVIYCNENCMQQDAFEHQPECKAYRNFGVAQRSSIEDFNAAYGDEKLRLLARIIRRQRRDGGNVDLTTDRPKEVKFRKLSDLMSHRENLLRDAVRSVHLQDYASDLYGFFANTTEEFSPFYTTVDEIEEYVGKMCINCFGIPVTTVDDEFHIGIAVYLTTSRFDHTCKPNLFMDFEGNRIIYRYFYENEQDKNPDYDKLSVSYGYTHTYSGFTAVATRQQRQISLDTRYYFQCTCEWCQDDRDTDLSEAATTRMCKVCKDPFVFQPDHVKGFTLRQLCKCPGQEGPFKDNFEEKTAMRDLDKLLKEWSTTFHPSEGLQSAADAITKVEPLRRLAHRYWHPILNLRYVQINEVLFHAYRSIALSGCPSSFTASPTIYPIPERGSMSPECRSKCVIAGCIAGEMTVMAYQERLEPYETVVARFCYQLAELYELKGHPSGAVINYQRALDIWKFHGARGEGQCKAIEQRMARLPKEAIDKSVPVKEIGSGVKEMKINGDEGAEEDAKKAADVETEPKKVQQGGKKKHKKKKKK